MFKGVINVFGTYLQFSLFCIALCKTFSILDLNDVRFTNLPKQNCDKDTNFVTVVHSAPKNFELRQMIRETWGPVDMKSKTFFILAQAQTGEEAKKVADEILEFGDIVQGSFVDAYRNMTYKHLLGYRFVRDYCSDVKFVLKTDDDQAVDTFHLPTYVETFINQSMYKLFFLCLVLKGKSVQRQRFYKWYVSPEEFAEDIYPEYCSGWAYVTNVNTITHLLEEAERRKDKYFWIDDVYVTGILRTDHIAVFNWVNAFSSQRGKMMPKILDGELFSPELMVGADLNAVDIKRLFKMFQLSEKKNYISFFYDNAERIEMLKPELENRGSREEL